jgi:rRNA-processing protein EBP2
LFGINAKAVFPNFLSFFMPPSSNPTKGPRKSTSPAKTSKDKPAPGPSKASKAKPKDVIPVPAAEPSEDEKDLEGEEGLEDDANSDEDSDDDGVDEAGMERLMKALGDDGLDEFETMQLHLTLGGGEGDEEGEGDDDEDTSDEEFTLDKNAEEASDGEGSDSEDGEDEEEFEDEEGEGEDGEEDVALDDVESVDEDAVPRQKIEIDNTVSPPLTAKTLSFTNNSQVALARIRETIQLDRSLPWTETLAVTYPDAIEVDVNDDLNRELAL